MLIHQLYSPENVKRAKYAQIGVVILSALICGYLIVTTVLGMRDIWGAQEMLRRGKRESAELSRQSANDLRRESKYPATCNGGVDAFAVQFSAWANARNIHLDSFVPEGTPSPAQIKVDGSDLGLWNSSKVRVRGSGEYLQVMSLLDKFRCPNAPVQLESFSFQASRTGAKSLGDS